MNPHDIVKALGGKQNTPKVVPNGLSDVQVKQFLELATRANTDQIKAMLTTLQGKLKERELLKTEGVQ